jgi:hypothetical protein
LARAEDLGDLKWVDLKRIIDDEGLEVSKQVGGPKSRTLDDIRVDISKARVNNVRSDAKIDLEDIIGGEDLNMSRQAFLEERATKVISDAEDLASSKWVDLKRIIDDEGLNVSKQVGGPKSRTLDDVRADILEARTTIDKSDAMPSAASARSAAVRPPTPAQAPTAEGVRPAPASSSLAGFGGCLCSRAIKATIMLSILLLLYLIMLAVLPDHLVDPLPLLPGGDLLPLLPVPSTTAVQSCTAAPCGTTVQSTSAQEPGYFESFFQQLLPIATSVKELFANPHLA